ncbi:PAS domain S-box protein [Natronobacterium lacisalsi]|nr:bacterio-opsin activator domain-containing protein [Halobiforma lacisalsi]
MDESGRPEPTLADVQRVFDALDKSGEPLTTAEVAEALGCERQGTSEKLHALAEQDALERKRTESGELWWRSADQRETIEAERGEEFQALVQAVTEYAIFMMDPNGIVQSWNTGAEQLKGYSEEEIIGEHFSIFYPDDAVEASVPENNLEKARERGYLEDEGWRIHKNGERFWANVTITPIWGDDDELRGFAKVTRDMTERHEYEERLRREKERFQRMVEEVQDYAIFMLDPEGYIQTWNEGAERIKGYREREIVGKHFSLFYPENREDRSPEEMLAQAAARGRVEDEGWRLRQDGSRFWANVVITALYDDDEELRGFVKVTRDLTERKRREDRLAALDEMGRQLLEAESPRDVSETVTDAAETDLDLPITMIALYDDESGTLRPLGQTTRAEQLQSDVPFLNPTSDVPWDAFGSDEPLVIDDLTNQFDQLPADPPIASGIIIPLGRHGVFITGFEEPERPSDEALDFVKIVAADLEAALDHVDRQQLLREREAALEDQNDSLARLNRINGIIRTIDQALIGASTRDEIEQAVCTELVTAGPYRVAWIGRQDAASESITPVAAAGIETDYVADLDIDTDDGPAAEHPAGIAARSREPYTIQDIRSDPPFEPWRKEALKRGYRSMISVPILYENTLYGVLTVQAEQPETFTGMEAQVIEELGETVAHAINALESKQALVSDEIIELAFRVRDSDVPLLRLVDRADCTFELDNVLSYEDGSLSAFFTTHGAERSAIEDFVEQSLAFSDLRLIVEDDEEQCTFEVTVDEGSIIATLLDHGAVPRTITAEAGEARVVVALSTQADVREFIEMLQSKYHELELTARRTRDRGARTPEDFKAAFEERITDRQREVLRTAYFSGFFDAPRRSTGEEIGEALGVSQPTVNHHLRASQRELLGMLYDETPPI